MNDSQVPALKLALCDIHFCSLMKINLDAFALNFGSGQCHDPHRWINLLTNRRSICGHCFQLAVAGSSVARSLSVQLSPEIESERRRRRRQQQQTIKFDCLHLSIVWTCLNVINSFALGERVRRAKTTQYGARSLLAYSECDTHCFLIHGKHFPFKRPLFRSDLFESVGY